MVNEQGLLEDAEVRFMKMISPRSISSPLLEEETLSEKSLEEKKLLLMRTIWGYLVRGISKALL